MMQMASRASAPFATRTSCRLSEVLPHHMAPVPSVRVNLDERAEAHVHESSSQGVAAGVRHLGRVCEGPASDGGPVVTAGNREGLSAGGGRRDGRLAFERRSRGVDLVGALGAPVLSLLLSCHEEGERLPDGVDHRRADAEGAGLR